KATSASAPGLPNGSTTQYIADRPGNATIDRGPAVDANGRRPVTLANHCNRKAHRSEKSRDEVAFRHRFALICSRVAQNRGRLVAPTAGLLLKSSGFLIDTSGSACDGNCEVAH